MIFLYLGLLVYVIGSFMLLVEEFKTGIVWGLLGLFFQFPHLIYCCLHFNEAKKPLGIMLSGLLIVIVGALFQN